MTRWTTEHSARLTTLWAAGEPQTAIARVLGFSAAYISYKAMELNLSPRENRRGRPAERRTYLIEEAAKRNLTVRQLKRNILSAVVRDRLISAVLDDDQSTAAS